ncbi:MAG: nitroreductase [Gammaproteobacteria bacterium]|nr:nitroreductase [Gammaproteobacteria bacterium]
MNKDLYEMIFKRKSFHLFRNVGNESITDEELKDIENAFNTFEPLDPSIKVKIKITKDDTTCKRGQEYCILMYSETKENYLQNIGYLGEQLDLYLVSKGIGTLWFGIGKPKKEKTVDGLTYVIMIAIKKIDSPDKFRNDMFKSKRKDLKDIWEGKNYTDIANIVRFTPSACNSQPWFVEASKEELKIYRRRKPGRVGIMSSFAVKYYNQIDMGIFLCFLELCLLKNNIEYTKEVFEETDHDALNNLTAVYKIK